MAKDVLMKVVKTIWNICSSVLVAVIVIVAMLLVGVKIFGFMPYTVLSGSMEPTYQTGSLVYVRETDTSDIPVGTPITYMVNETTVVTHRVIEKLIDEEDPNVVRYRTKGDNNDYADGQPVHYKNVIGKVVFSIPYLGYFAAYIQSPPGLYVAIAVALVLVILVFLPDILFAEPKKKEEKTEEGTAEELPPADEADTPVSDENADASAPKE